MILILYNYNQGDGYVEVYSTKFAMLMCVWIFFLHKFQMGAREESKNARTYTNMRGHVNTLKPKNQSLNNFNF